MKTSKHLRYEYIEKIYKLFPHTLFQFTFQKNTELKWSKKRTFKDSDKFSFFRKDSYFRSNLWNENSDEIRLDFDYKTIEENIYRMRGVIEILLEVGIEQFETYLTGGKGSHLTFRFNFKPFIGNDRQSVRNELFNALKLNAEIDKTLFQTIQVIGLEGFNHRKTNIPKQRIKLDCDNYKILDVNINFEYLKDTFINNLNEKLTNVIISSLDQKIPKSTKFTINLTKTTYFDQKKLIWSINKFKNIYLEINDGKKRLLDMLTRYLILTTKSEETTKIILLEFSKSLNLKLNVESRVKSTLNSMKSNAIFIYKDVLTKVEFYKGWPWADCNEPLVKNK